MSVETSLAEVTTELRNTRSWISELAGHQRGDHDTLIRVEASVTRLIETVNEIREEAAEARKEWAAEARRLQEKIDAAEKEREREEKDEANEGRSRNWQLWMLVLSPLVAAAISAAVAVMMAAGK